MASQRRQHNEITKLKDSSGNFYSNQTDLERIAVDYFQEMFTSFSTGSCSQVIHHVHEVVTLEMNNMLLEEFTQDKVKKALFQMNPTKALGSDDMNSLFFQKYWHFVGTDVSEAILDCINFGKFLQSINFTHVTLIPKKKNPKLMSHFRPINLCNVIFKLVSKVLANRLKRILKRIISDCQNAFVAKRVITDNILISFEILHYMKSKLQGNTTHMTLKLDMSKAYDRVKWGYLKGIMLKMGFHQGWVDLDKPQTE